MSRRDSSGSSRKPRRPEWEDGGGIDDDGEPNPTPEPVLPLPSRSYFRPGPDKVSVLANRHAAGQSLWHPADLAPVKPCDVVEQLAELGRYMHQLDLAGRGLDWLAKGISTVPGVGPADPVQYRAQVWDPNQDDHIEIGRAKTYGGAFDLIVAWAARHLGVDVRFRRPAWLTICLTDAIRARHPDDFIPEDDDHE